MIRHPLLLALTLCPLPGFTAAEAANMAMGFRVREVTHSSAIIWTRITRDPQRNWDGSRDPKKRESKQVEYAPAKVKVEDREGATPGANMHSCTM